MKALPAPTFSIRWTATLTVPQPGDYGLGIARQECDTCPGTISTRFYLDDRLIVNENIQSRTGAMSNTSSVHLQAGKPYKIRVEYVQRGGGSGFELVWKPPVDALLSEALETAKQSDLAILCLGLNSRLEGEESPIQIPGFDHGDRTDIRLPDAEEKLLGAVLDTGKPVIVVLLNGSALAVQLAKDRAKAILEAWYPGQEGGTAIAKTLSGEYNPAGRLPVTFYESVDQLPSFTDYSMKRRTYRYFTGKPLYPFGYGLSYAEFGYSNLSIAPDKTKLTARVTNKSETAGDEIVQLYVRKPVGNAELRGFQRIHLGARESKAVEFSLSPSDIQNATLVSVGGGQPLREWTGDHYVELRLQQ
ncbi:MAG: glycoside hydrolase family 3 C-terminal domain-containing protein [Bryobacteraceae bacterium]